MAGKPRKAATNGHNGDTLSDFRPAVRNANKHTQRGLGMLDKSMQTDGYLTPLTVAADGEAIDGSARLERVAEVFADTPPLVVHHDGKRPVIMVRDDIPNANTPQALRLAIAANRVGQVDLEFDGEVLAELAKEIDLSEFWFKDELAELLGNEAMNGDAPEAQIDKAAELQEKWQVKRGDVWQVGRHRLMCGDSTSAEDVTRLMGDAKPMLMVTDPPYGVDYDPKWRNEAAKKGLIAFARRREGEVMNDDRIDWSDAFRLFSGDVAYCWHAGRHASSTQHSLEESGFEIRCQVIWGKSNFAISRGHYHWKHEPCWYAVRKGNQGHWIGDHSQTTLWEINWDKNAEGGHGTQKPLECMARPIRNHEGDVYDPFIGSGTTLVACEQLGRIGYGMEIEPKYCAVTLERLQAMGLTPVLSL